MIASRPAAAEGADTVSEMTPATSGVAFIAMAECTMTIRSPAASTTAAMWESGRSRSACVAGVVRSVSVSRAARSGVETLAPLCRTHACGSRPPTPTTGVWNPVSPRSAESSARSRNPLR